MYVSLTCIAQTLARGDGMSFNLATILTETTLATPDAPVCRFGGNPTSYRELDVCAPPPHLDQYDVVLCEQVLEHVVDPWRAAKTLHDLCVPGGHVVVSTPFLIRVHPTPLDLWRFTEDGLRMAWASDDAYQPLGRVDVNARLQAWRARRSPSPPRSLAGEGGGG